MEFVSLKGIEGDTSTLSDELRRLGGGVGWWRWDAEDSGIEALHAVLPDDPEQAARCRALIEQARAQT